METQQERAIHKTDGPCVILAGAGTGKTYTIVEKIKYILEKKIYRPSRIVCLTFSNEAAASMRARILKVTNDEEPIIRTFHSFCADLLRKHGSKIGIDGKFKILLPDDAKILLHKNFKVLPYNCHSYVSAISTAKDLGIRIEDFKEYLDKQALKYSDDLENEISEMQFNLHVLHLDKKRKEEAKGLKSRIEELSKFMQRKKFYNAWNSYEKLKAKKNLVDYSDLNKFALKLLEDFPEITNEFDYVVVDEFQDTNKLQCDFLEKLAPKKNITVVGDLNQSIYRFRGAYKDNFSNFKKSFGVKEEDIFSLDKSFRSTNKILRAANKLIANNYEDKKDFFEVMNVFGEEGEKIKAFELINNKEEARKMLEIIQERISEGVAPSQICIMFRTHQQSRILKSLLERNGIDYTSATKKSLLKMKQVRMALDLLEIAHKANENAKGGEGAWWSLIHDGGSSKNDEILISRIIRSEKDNECLSKRIIEKFLSEGEVEIENERVSEKGRIMMRVIIDKLNKTIENISLPSPELLLKIYSICGFGYDHEEIDKEEVLILRKFYDFVKEFSEIDSSEVSALLHHVDILRSLGIEIESPTLENGGVRLMTHHATKGLEYHTVIVSNMAQTRFPMMRAEKSIIPSELSPELASLIQGKSEEEADAVVREHEAKNQLLEERRLCYVAFTRAKKNLFLTYAKEYGSKKYPVSQFLREIDYDSSDDFEFVIDEEAKYSEEEPAKFVTAEDYGSERKGAAPNGVTFSPSSLQMFNECQKRYEYKYVYNMPDPKPISWELLRLGSFTHLIFEEGVRMKLSTEKEFIDLAKTLHMKEEWNFVDLDEVIPLVKVFFFRNRGKYNENSRVEVDLAITLDGIRFYGKADRIDFTSEGLTIVDYKTGATDIKPLYRNWQMGYYAIAASKLGKPRRIILDMLKKDLPVEFVIDEDGNAKEIHSARTSFNLNAVREEIVGTAREILRCYEKGFRACALEKNCEFCNEYVWRV